MNREEKKINLDQPDPNGGVSSATLAMALGKSPEEALKIDHDIQKIVRNIGHNPKNRKR